jgi:hypothetical protein
MTSTTRGRRALTCEDTSPGQAAMNNGSATSAKGDEVPSGMISVELTPGVTPGWRGLEFIARSAVRCRR